MSLQTTWFILIGVLWSGFFVLEGFDFGVGMLTPVIGRDVSEQGTLKETTGPFWDGNEVWLIVAAGATFAAFPDWYATMFSAYYLPLLVVLVALILRATGTEYRDRRDSDRWRTAWDWVIAGACLVAPLLLGIVLGGLLGGLPIDADHEFTGGFVDLVQPYALLTGVTFLGLSLLQGAAFLRLRTTDALRNRAGVTVRRTSIVAVVLLCAQLAWTTAVDPTDTVIPGPWAWLAVTAAVAAAIVAHEQRHEGWAFALSSAAVAFTIANLFATLYPNTMVSTTSAADSLTTELSSSSYTLTLMTIVAAVMVPVVLVYTAWNYWVFRQRVRPRVSGPPADEATNV